MVVKITLRLNDKRQFELADGRRLDELNPKEMLLYATADCAGRTIVGLLKEHIVTVSSMEITFEGTLSTPTVVAESRYTHFNIIYKVECHTLKDQIVVSRAINLAHDKYCGLLQMMRRIAPLSHQTSIVTTDEVTA
ncbi:MAG: OsmC family protein [Alistipes sp.]|nr:OsmC family protein [Alistipes sp.]